MTLSHGWTSRRFDQLGELCSGSTPSSSRTEFWDGATVWVTPTDLSRLNTPYLHDSAKHITARGLRNCSARLLPPSSIVLSSRAPIGYVAIPTVPFCTNQGCKSIALHNSYHSEFVYYAVTAAVPRLKRLGEGTTFAEISKSSLAKAEVVLPIDKAEQAKIAEVLSTVDRAIEETEALIAKQQRIKTGLMQDLLTRGIDEHGDLRSEQTREFKDSPLGRVPAGWAVATLNQLTPADAPIGYGIVQPGAYDPSGVPVAGIYTINSDFEKWHMSSSAIEVAYQRSRIRPGDVLLSIKGSTGRVGVVPPNKQGNISREIARIRPGSTLNPHFIRFQLLSNSYQRYLLNAEVGTTRAELSIKVLRELFAAVPPPAEQDEIALRLASAERNLNATHLSFEKLRRVKIGLMQDLLTGNRRVTALLEQREGDTIMSSCTRNGGHADVAP